MRVLTMVMSACLMLISAESFAEQKIVFVLEDYQATHSEPLVQNTCKDSCYRESERIENYTDGGWKIITEIPNQSVVSEISDPELGDLITCTCTGKKFVIQK